MTGTPRKDNVLKAIQYFCISMGVLILLAPVIYGLVYLIGEM